MTVESPPEPILPPPRRPWGVLVLVAVVLVVVGYLAFSSIGSALVYYLTPTELLERTGQTDPDAAFPRWLRPLASVRPADHFRADDDRPLLAKVHGFLREEGISWSAARVLVLVNAR